MTTTPTQTGVASCQLPDMPECRIPEVLRSTQGCGPTGVK